MATLSSSTNTLLRNALTKTGIDNPYLQNGIIAQAATESNFKPVAELSYRNTPVSRLRAVFGIKVAKYSDAQLEFLKQDDVKFFDIVYGGLYGNTLPGDGYKYRGRGFNQITFKNIYKTVGQRIGYDLVNNPDLLLQENVAALALADFYKQAFDQATANGTLKAKIGVTNVRQINSNELAVKAAIQANSGFGTNNNTDFFKGITAKALAFLEQNPVATGSGIVTVLILLGAFFFN